jgi:hypothetical protein
MEECFTQRRNVREGVKGGGILRKKTHEETDKAEGVSLEAPDHKSKTCPTEEDEGAVDYGQTPAIFENIHIKDQSPY